MQRLICFLLAVCLLFCLCACKQHAPENPVTFYYPFLKNTCAENRNVLAEEIRETVGNTDVSSLITLYLNGPDDAKLASPFPAGTNLVAIHAEKDTITITLTDRFATLSGIELTLASTALGLTCMKLTGAKTVQIQTQAMALNGSEQIVINADNLLLSDDLTAIEAE